MTAYYNEWDKQAAAWLRELIKNGHIADGVVDERDIKEVEPADLRGFTQCHFFAGIGGWSVALRLAGWSDDRPVWTGSPPCQPFSVAGRGKGIEDDRHIAPVWLNLVKECRPAILFGEQVAAATTKDGWLDSLQDALENEGYATGAAVLPACSVNAPHIRQRLWFTARFEDTSGIGWSGRGQRHHEAEADRPNAQTKTSGSSTVGGMGNTDNQRLQGHRQSGELYLRQPNGKNKGRQYTNTDLSSGLADTTSQRLQGSARPSKAWGFGYPSNSSAGGLADTTNNGHAATDGLRKETESPEPQGSECVGKPARGGNYCPAYASETQWGNPDWLWCRDGKWRPVESSTFPLAHGIPARVGRLRGYGNAIVPQVAAEVIQVMMGYDV